jgi:hypothetical protein
MSPNFCAIIASIPITMIAPVNVSIAWWLAYGCAEHAAP